jgi:hypothetical protein
VRILPNDWRELGDSGEEIFLTVGEDRGTLASEYFWSAEAE